MADPWQPASFNLKLPGWAQVPGNLVKGLERADQQKRAIGILTGRETESWVQRAAMSDPANWMAAPAPASQGWRGIYGLPETTPARVKGASRGAQEAQGPAAVLSDDVDARASEARRMLQQATPYWEREENKGLRLAAQSEGPRAGETGYAQRADIQAWMDANKNAPKGADGKNIVDRFLEQQQKRGLLEAPGQGGSGFSGERIAMPADSESAVQAGTRGLVGFEGNALAQAQASVAELQGRERAALTQQIFQAAAQGKLPDFAVPVPKNIDVAFNRSAGIPDGVEAFTGLEVGQPFTNPEMNRQLASLGQPAAIQAVATGTGSGANLQPSSAAASEAGVEPAQPDAPGNRPNPADDLARRYVEALRTTRAVRLGS